MAEKRKTEMRLSLEDATSAAERKRALIFPSNVALDIPLEIQMQIWTPLVKEMNALDLMDISKIPSWSLEGVRKILSYDDTWMFLWDRDFRANGTGLCDKVPLRIPEFLTTENGDRGRINPGDEVFLRNPWRRYWIWTYFSLRTLSKSVAYRVNMQVLENKMRYDTGEAVQGLEAGFPLPLGLSISFNTFSVAPKTTSAIQIKPLDSDQDPKPSGMNILDFMSHSLDDDLPYDVPEGGTWVASSLFWEDESDWNFPILVGRYLISMGIQNLDVNPPIPFWARKYILSWLIWCIMESDIPDPDEEGGDGPELQGRTRRDVLDWMARHFTEVLSRTVLMPEQIPIVPRKMDDGRLKLFLGSQICSNCGLEAEKRCKACKKVFYCTKECQREHWSSGHRNECK